MTKELFENAPLKGGLYKSTEKTSKFIFKLTNAHHVQLLTYPHDYCDKSAWHWWKIHMKMIDNPHELAFILHTIDV